jgi:hypothetical protein
MFVFVFAALLELALGSEKGLRPASEIPTYTAAGRMIGKGILWEDILIGCVLIRESRDSR